LSKVKRIVHTDNLLDKALSCLGWTVFDAAIPAGLPEHIHEDDYEICYVVQGELHWWVNDKTYIVKRGDYFVTKPSEPHGGVNGVMQRCEIYWIQFNGRHIQQALLDGFSSINHRAFPASQSMSSVFYRLMDEQQNTKPYAALLSHVTVHEILIDLVRSYQAFIDELNRRSVGYTPEIANSLQWIEEHLAEKLTVSLIAATVGMSASYFQKRFLTEVGMPPAEYWTQQRIKHAKQLLEQNDQSISDIAFLLGFASSQYFSTVFKKYTGLTPSQYQHNF